MSTLPAVTATPDPGLLTAAIVALGFGIVTLALVALHHASRLTVIRALVAVGVGAGVVAIAVSGALLAVAPPAHAAAPPAGPTIVVTSGEGASSSPPSTSTDLEGWRDRATPPKMGGAVP